MSDGLYGILSVPGLFDLLGPQNVYRSHASLTYTADKRFQKAVSGMVWCSVVCCGVMCYILLFYWLLIVNWLVDSFFFFNHMANYLITPFFFFFFFFFSYPTCSSLIPFLFHLSINQSFRWKKWIYLLALKLII